MESEVKRKLNNIGLSEDTLEYFLGFFNKYKKGSAKVKEWQSINSPTLEKLPKYESLSIPQDIECKNILEQLAVCKLNGGLGTSMGCSGPKSLIKVRDNKSFLDLIFDQLTHLNKEFGVNVPLYLMNSFYTHPEIEDYLKNKDLPVSIISFLQSKFPRLDKESGEPLAFNKNSPEAWYPPGHGDIFHCLQNQGLLNEMLEKGIKVLFVSNADNLGAEVDLKILNTVIKNKIPFVLEMTPKTPLDVKGGTLYESNNNLHLLEVAQVPKEYLSEFCGIEKFKVFNTNNVWIHLECLQERLEKGPLDLNLIINEKRVEDLPVIQLETAIGSAIDNFSESIGLIVNRNRFLPVKNTSDLMLIQSDLFNLNKGKLTRNSKRKISNLPIIKWGKQFSQFEDYKTRVPEVPKLLNLDFLEIEGDVSFKGEITFSGQVVIKNKNGPISFPSGTILNNQTIQK